MKTCRGRYGGIVFLILVSLLIGSGAMAYTAKEIYQQISPGVVFILASDGSQKANIGTGSIIRSDGLIITNTHVLLDKDKTHIKPNIGIHLKPKRISGNLKHDLRHAYAGEVLAYDIPLDLALLKIKQIDHRLQTVKFADAQNVSIGDRVFAIGHPEQGGLWSLTTGVVSAFYQNYGGVRGKNLFQTDASINRGNSGGPLLDELGAMIGINSLIARKAADGLMITDVNFSIRSNVALQWLRQQGYVFATAVPKMAADRQEKEPTPLESGQKTDKQKPESSQKVRLSQKAKPPASKEMPRKPPQPKILTPKNPYRQDTLLQDMQEMEDMMDEMRDMIRGVKKK
ncbi:MAG: serine protease [Desulfobacterales bacterium]